MYDLMYCLRPYFVWASSYASDENVRMLVLAFAVHNAKQEPSCLP